MTKKKKGYGYKQGKFTPLNMNKYKGSFPIIYRSSWELKALKYLDLNSKILSWGSESVIVNYKDPTKNNSTHRYFLDLVFSIKKADRIETYIVEIKPDAQTRPPKKGKRITKTFLAASETYARNCAKWKAASAFAKRRGYKFCIWTEKELKITM